METNSKKVLAALPDFDEYMSLAEQIKSLYISKMKLENDIKAAESEAFREVMTNPKYFINGKAVAVSYFENAYRHGGLNGEIADIRSNLLQVVGMLDNKKTQFELYKMMHDLYKVLAYQETSMK